VIQGPLRDRTSAKPIKGVGRYHHSFCRAFHDPDQDKPPFPVVSFAIFFMNPREGFMHIDPTAQMALAGFGVILVISVGLLIFFVTRKMSK
jgi:hypothetical protein